MHQISLRCGLLALLAAPAFAQSQFESALGTALLAGDDTIEPGNALGFSFPMPGGTLVTSVDVDTNGRILPPGGDTSDLSETVAELLTDTIPHPSICVQWDDINPASTVAGVDDVYFNTDGVGKAWITWHNVVQFGATVIHTMQVQLFADGRVTFLYDSRVPADEPLVGLSQGNGATDPGGSNFSAAPLVTAGVTTVYEDFASFDLMGSALEFYPDGTGGWIVLRAPVTDLNASAVDTGPGCYAPGGPCLVYVPDGIGGYVVSRATGLYDTNIGTSYGATGDDQIPVGNKDLTFVFPFPGGTSSQFIDIDTNGRVLRDATETASDLSPTVLEFRTEAWPVICVQADWNVALANSDDIYFSTTAGTSARITWKDVAQFGSTGAASAVVCTFQFQLYSTGMIIICLEDMANFNPSGISSADDLLVGVSPGGGVADPGETDYSALVAVSAGAINYEFIDVPAETPDYGIVRPVLVSATVPKRNTSWDLRIDRLPSGTVAAWFLIGFSNPVIDLGPLGVPCTLRVLPQLAAIPATLPGGSSTDPLSIAISNTAELGIAAYVQGVTAPTGVNPFLPLVLTNGIKGTIGM